MHAVVQIFVHVTHRLKSLLHCCCLLSRYTDAWQLLQQKNNIGEWWSGRSTTAHIVFNLQLIIVRAWRKHQHQKSIKSVYAWHQPIVFLNVLQWQISPISNLLVEIWNGYFPIHSVCRFGGRELGIYPFDSTSMGSYQLQAETYGPTLLPFWVI